MPRQIRQDVIIEAVLDGIEEAEKTYEQWSGGASLAFTAEHLINAFIAKSIMKVSGAKFITVEQSCKGAIEAACGKRKGRLAHATRSGGRIDLLLWWAKDLPRAAIEIKNNVYSYEGQCAADIDRIAKLLLIGTENSLQFGLFVFYSSVADGKIKTAKQKLENRYRTILSRAQSAWGQSLRIEGTNRVHEYGDGAWVDACVVLRRP